MGAVAKSGDVASQLRMLVRGRSVIDVAQFQFIGLAEIESAYGSRWPTHRRRINEVARGFLQKRIGPSDVIVEGADGFLLVFNTLSGRDAEIAALGLSHGLSDFFLGELRDELPRVGVSVRTMPAAQIAESFGDVEVHGADISVDEKQESAIDWRFQPVWDVKREALTSFYTVPYSRATRTRVPGYQFENLSHRLNCAAIDEEGLRRSEIALRQLIQDGQRALVGVSIHAASLTSDASRTRLLAVIDSLDHDLFKYRLVKIAGVAPGFPRLYLAEALAALGSRLPRISIGAAWNETDASSLAKMPCLAVGFAMPPVSANQNPVVGSAQLLARLRAGIETVHAAKRSCFVEGAVTAEVARHLCAAGIDNLSTPILWSPGSAPVGAMKWPASRLLAHG